MSALNRHEDKIRLNGIEKKINQEGTKAYMLLHARINKHIGISGISNAEQ